MTGTAFFDRTYDETLALLIEARNYIASQVAEDRRCREPPERLRISCESLRVTSRLTEVMAWALAQKAVHAGEMAPDAAAETYAITGSPVCREAGGAADPTLPRGLRSLLERTQQLYERVARLDGLARRRSLS